MSDDQTSKKRRPESGARWIDYVPSWARIGIPLIAVLISLAGFALGFGEGKGRADAQIGGLESRAERYERQRDSDQAAIGMLRAEVAEIRGEIRAIGRALGVPMPGPRLPPEGPAVREVAP